MKKNLTKIEIVQAIYTKNPNAYRKEIVDAVQGVFDIMQEALLQGRNIEIRGFGALTHQVRKARVGRNPNKPTATVVIPRRRVIKFKAGKEMKANLKKLAVE